MRSGTQAYTTLSSATPVPGALAMATLPARHARISPGTPRVESGRNTSESQYTSSIRR